MGYDLRKGRTLGNNPNWLNAHMDRTMNMYETGKNYPCITFWSLGNEAGNGYNFYITYNWLKTKATTRPVQYERALLEWNTDIYCPNTRVQTRWKNGVTPKQTALTLCQNTPMPWETAPEISWISGMQSIATPIYKAGSSGIGLTRHPCERRNGNPVLGLCGDFGENSPSDGNFLCNGVVGPDRERIPV